MRLGMYLDLRNPAHAARPWPKHYARWIERVEEAERRGADSVWLTEHHFFDDGYLPQCFTFAAALASRTSTVRLCSAVSLLPLHSPLEIAEQVALVDILSNGRVQPGFGIGYRRPEYQAFGGNFKRRYSIFETRIQQMRGLWGEVGYDGPQVTPRPVQQPLPLWCGFGGPQGARLAGRLGTGLLSLQPELLEPYLAGLEEGGHPKSDARMAGSIEFLLADDPEQAWAITQEYAAYRWNSYNRYMFEGTTRPAPDPVDPSDWTASGRFLIGTPPQVAAAIREKVRDLPVTDVYGWSDFPGAPDALLDRHLELTFSELRPLLAE